MIEPEKCPECGRVECRRWDAERRGRAATDGELAACRSAELAATKAALAKAKARMKSLMGSDYFGGVKGTVCLLDRLAEAEAEVERLRGLIVDYDKADADYHGKGYGSARLDDARRALFAEAAKGAKP